ncbi:MAG: rhombosortase [Gammaproteobacteria bacterium]|nr:rhombosortase [Gammaproteobacteria bacterium]
MTAGFRGFTIIALRAFRPAWPLAAIAAIALLLGALGDWSDVALRYERAAVLDGEIWRLASGHLVHLSASHLWLNLGGMALVVLLFGRAVPAGQWWLAALFSLLVTSAGFLILEPQLQWYVGLSGMLHGLILAGAYLDVTFPCRERNILVVIVIAKLLWEQAYGALPFTAEAAGGPVVVDAHLYGAIGGIAAVVAIRARDRRRTQV